VNLNQILSSNWFDLDGYEAEDYESNFRSSHRTRHAINLWIDHELSKLDKEMSLQRIKEKPDRAELALIVMARREQLLAFRALLEIDK
jgi:hypothetical protein